MAKHDELVAKLYENHVKPMGLPPRLAGEIRHALNAAAKATKGDRKGTKAAIVEYLTSKGYDAEGKKLDKPKKKGKRGRPPKSETSTTKKGKKVKKTKAKKTADDAEEVEEAAPKKRGRPSKDPAKEKLEAAGKPGKKALKGDPEAGIPAGNVDLRKLGRPTLKGMVKDFDLGYKKSDTDDALRAKLAPHLVGMDSDVKKLIATSDPSKVEASKDCVGVLIDLTKAICITCPKQQDCRKLFNEHRENGWKMFQTIQPDGAPAAKEKGTALPADSKQIDVLKVGKLLKLPTVKIDNEDVEVATHFKFLKDVKTSAPETVGELRAIMLKHFKTTAPDDTLAWLLKYTKAVGLINVL